MKILTAEAGKLLIFMPLTTGALLSLEQRKYILNILYAHSNQTADIVRGLTYTEPPPTDWIVLAYISIQKSVPCHQD
jgi:hypothetical protein